jgi:thiol-disulfide isomerase/thioredoxin
MIEPMPAQPFSRLQTANADPGSVLIACLCAQWCGTCTEYAPLFKQLEADFPQATFAWVDIEDEADTVDPVEVENFPTILIASAGVAQFFGTVTPHIDTLRRLIQSHLDPAASTKAAPEIQQLVQRLLERPTTSR